ncbi:hypothetical protein JCM14036_28260 [Desulfotomaculum defluvii]
MWNWDESNPWSKWGKKQHHDKDQCHHDPFDDDEYEQDHYCNDFDCGPDPELLHKIIKAICILKREIDKCEKILCDPRFGLKEIKREVRNIERGVFSPTFGLPEIKAEVSEILDIVNDLDIEFPITLLNDIKAEVSNIESAVFNPTFGLLEIKSEVSAVETIVGGIQDMLDNGTFGLVEIKSEVSEILAIVTDIVLNPVFGISEIKAEVSTIENAVLSETFGLAEIKSEVSEILSIVSNLNVDIEIPITLLNDIKSEISAIESAIFNPTFGLAEIKAEVSAIESAVFNATFGLLEIKSEVSQILANQMESPSLFLTSGPYLRECEEENIVVKALNNTTEPQTVTFVVRPLGFAPPLCPPFATVTFDLEPCSSAEEVLDLTEVPLNVEIRAIRSNMGVLIYAATTTCSGRKVTNFKHSDFVPVPTFCLTVCDPVF